MAALIVNLSDKPVSFQVEVSGGFKPLIIEGNETWRVPGKAKVRFKGREVLINDDEEYAVWSGDDFGPQRHLNHSTASH